VRRLEVDERGAEGGDGRPGRDALQEPGDRQHGDVARDQEQQQSDELEPDRGGEHGPAPDVVGQRADHEERAEETDHVDGEDGGEHPRGEPPLLLVDDIQRGGRAGGGQEEDDDRRDGGEDAGRRRCGRFGGGGGSDGHGLLAAICALTKPTVARTHRSLR
jgi:hypothetical protein